MKKCSLFRKLRIVPGGFDDYKQLAQYHYLDARPGPFEAIFALKPVPAAGFPPQTFGVIVYSLPSPRLQPRNLATQNFFVGFDRSTQLALINRNVRCISRVIIEPRFRGLGLAARLVQQTMPKMNVPIIETLAVMGLVNPFFEKAGMKALMAEMPAKCVRLIEAFSMVGIEEKELIDAEKAQQKLARLPRHQHEFIEGQIRLFLKSHGSRRNLRPCLQRTKYILSRLTARGVYYIWFNPKFDTGCSAPDAHRESARENI